MDNFDLINFDGQEGGAKQPSQEDEPLKIDLGAQPGPAANGGVSRQPLNLGGGAPAPKKADVGGECSLLSVRKARNKDQGTRNTNVQRLRSRGASRATALGGSSAMLGSGSGA